MAADFAGLCGRTTEGWAAAAAGAAGAAAAGVSTGFSGSELARTTTAARRATEGRAETATEGRATTEEASAKAIVEVGEWGNEKCWRGG